VARLLGYRLFTGAVAKPKSGRNSGEGEREEGSGLRWCEKYRVPLEARSTEEETKKENNNRAKPLTHVRWIRVKGGYARGSRP